MEAWCPSAHATIVVVCKTLKIHPVLRIFDFHETSTTSGNSTQRFSENPYIPKLQDEMIDLRGHICNYWIRSDQQTSATCISHLPKALVWSNRRSLHLRDSWRVSAAMLFDGIEQQSTILCGVNGQPFLHWRYARPASQSTSRRHRIHTKCCQESMNAKWCNYVEHCATFECIIDRYLYLSKFIYMWLICYYIILKFTIVWYNYYHSLRLHLGGRSGWLCSGMTLAGWYCSALYRHFPTVFWSSVWSICTAECLGPLDDAQAGSE